MAILGSNAILDVLWGDLDQSHLTSSSPWAKLPQHLELAREQSATIDL
jgi:hypothetical protein